MSELDEAIERSIAGLKKKNRILTDKERRVTAYHEAGHAVVGEMLPHTSAVQKISIVSRGALLGYVLSPPSEDRYSKSKDELLDDIAMGLGGRAAEEVVFGEAWTGVTSDLQRATSLAEAMVKEYGMSDAIGLVAHREDRRSEFLGMSAGDRDYSEETARKIDAEVARIVGECHQRARDILEESQPALNKIVEILLEKEVMEGDELRLLLNGSCAAGSTSSDAGDSAPTDPHGVPPQDGPVQEEPFSADQKIAGDGEVAERGETSPPAESGETGEEES
jgi:cell division protease FtsH